MKDYLITEIMQGMLPYLDNAQLMRLREKLTECLSNKVVTGGSMVDNDTGTWTCTLARSSHGRFLTV